jgi:hypothetical protein
MDGFVLKQKYDDDDGPGFHSRVSGLELKPRPTQPERDRETRESTISATTLLLPMASQHF